MKLSGMYQATVTVFQAGSMQSMCHLLTIQSLNLIHSSTVGQQHIHNFHAASHCSCCQHCQALHSDMHMPDFCKRSASMIITPRSVSVQAKLPFQAEPMHQCRSLTQTRHCTLACLQLSCSCRLYRTGARLSLLNLIRYLRMFGLREWHYIPRCMTGRRQISFTTTGMNRHDDML